LYKWDSPFHSMCIFTSPLGFISCRFPFHPCPLKLFVDSPCLFVAYFCLFISSFCCLSICSEITLHSTTFLCHMASLRVLLTTFNHFILKYLWNFVLECTFNHLPWSLIDFILYCFNSQCVSNYFALECCLILSPFRDV